MPIDEPSDDGVMIGLTGEIHNVDGRMAAARLQIGGVGVQIIAVAAYQEKLRAFRGGEAGIGLRNRRRASENPNISTRRRVHWVTRRQKSDIILGSRSASNFVQLG